MPAWVPWLLGGVAGSAVAAVWGLRRRATRAHRPRRGDIWWADIPFADGSGSKVRPCLIVRGGLRGITVLKITSQDKSRRRDHVTIPTRAWDPYARHDSYLNLGELFVVRRQAFQRRAGACDPAVMREVLRKPWKRAKKPRTGRTPHRGH